MIWIPLQLFILGVLYGMLMLVSRLFGAGDTHGIRKITHQGLFLGHAMGCLAAAAAFILSNLISWFGVAPELVAPAGLGLSSDVFGIRGWWIALTFSISLVAVLLAMRVRKIFWALEIPAKTRSLIDNEN